MLLEIIKIDLTSQNPETTPTDKLNEAITKGMEQGYYMHGQPYTITETRYNTDGGVAKTQYLCQVMTSQRPHGSPIGKYKLVAGSNNMGSGTDQFNAEMQDLLDNNWEPFGPPTVVREHHSDTIYQAVVMYP